MPPDPPAGVRAGGAPGVPRRAQPGAAPGVQPGGRGLAEAGHVTTVTGSDWWDDAGAAPGVQTSS